MRCFCCLHCRSCAGSPHGYTLLPAPRVCGRTCHQLFGGGGVPLRCCFVNFRTTQRLLPLPRAFHCTAARLARGRSIHLIQALLHRHHPPLVFSVLALQLYTSGCVTLAVTATIVTPPLFFYHRCPLLGSVSACPFGGPPASVHKDLFERPIRGPRCFHSLWPFI